MGRVFQEKQTAWWWNQKFEARRGEMRLQGPAEKGRSGTQ